MTSFFRPSFWKIPEVTAEERQRLSQLTATLEQRLQEIAERFPQSVFASSLAVEDMVITDAICRLKLPIRIITLNTGKLNPETEALIAATNARVIKPNWKCSTRLKPKHKPLKRNSAPPPCTTAWHYAANAAISAKSNRSTAPWATRPHG